MLKMQISRLGHLDAQGKKEKGPPSYEPKKLRSVKLRDVEKVDDRIKRDELWDHIRRWQHLIRLIVLIWGGHWFFPGKKTLLLNGRHNGWSKKVSAKTAEYKCHFIAFYSSPLCGCNSIHMLVTNPHSFILTASNKTRFQLMLPVTNQKPPNFKVFIEW